VDLAEVEPGPVVRWRLDLAYDGSGFRGFAVQDGVPTVAGALARALQRVARTEGPIPVTCAGRTDAGVHARAQVVHVDLPAPALGAGPPGAPPDLDPERLVRSLNRQLAPAIVVRSASVAPAGFDARRSAVSRAYRYLVWNAPVPDPLLAPVAWHVEPALDLRAMAAATDVLIGEHDFRAFCRRAPGTGRHEPIPRVVTRAEWSVVPSAAADAGGGRLLRLDIEAGSFCHQMVRSLVGCLVDVGRGRGNAATTLSLLRAGERSSRTAPAPALGLCLVAVRYP
jgi:tRNA pseudouridine38-40 synthase